MSNIDFQVLNALNLINVKLGEAYEAKGFNPFELGFELNSAQVLRLLNMRAEKKAFVPPQMLDDSAEKLKVCLNSAKKRALILAANLQKQTQINNMSLKKEIPLCRIVAALLALVNTKKLNYEEILDIYQTIMALGGEYSSIFKKLFDKNFDMQVAIQEFMRFAVANKTAPQPLQNKEDLTLLVHGKSSQNAQVSRPSPIRPKEQSMQK